MQDVESSTLSEVVEGDAGIEAGALPLPSWEQRNELGIWVALLRTLQEFYTFRIRESFQHMPRERGASGVLFFLIITSILFRTIHILTCGFFSFQSAFTEFKERMLQFYIYSTVQILGGTLLLVLVVCVLAWVVHGILVLLTRHVGSFDGTLRVMGYAMGASLLLNVGLVGGLLAGWLWFWGTLTIGLCTVHGCSRLSATIAVLPAVLGYVIICVLEIYWFTEVNHTFFLR